MSESESNPTVEVLALVHGSTRAAAAERAKNLSPAKRERILSAFKDFKKKVVGVEADAKPDGLEING